MKTCWHQHLFLLCFALLTLLFHIWLTFIYDQDVKFAELMQTRRLVISSTCQQKSSFQDTRRRNLLLLPLANTNFYWCPIQGIALENTLYSILLHLAGVSEEDLQVLSDIYGKMNLKEIVEEGLQMGSVNISHSSPQLILTVAHPHARLVSIYEQFYKEFHLNYFLEHGQHMQKNQQNKTSFPQFVDYVTEHPNVEQWMPISQLCQICLRPFYHYVLKSQSGFDMTQYYMDQLSPVQEEKIRRLYWMDFAAFEYH